MKSEGRISPNAFNAVFEQLKPEMREWLKENGIEKPTPIQQLAFDPISDGKHCILIAPAGHGKTLAALLPLLNRLEPSFLCILFICPLRALNRDIFKRIRELGERIGFKVEVRHGDTPQKARRMQAMEPPHLLITTPETLQAILIQSKFRAHLKNLKAVIVDELHELIDSKRGAQLAIALERLEELSRFQRIGLSAIKDENLARLLAFGKEVEVVEAAGGKRYEIEIAYADPSEGDAELAKELALSSFDAFIIRKLKELCEHRPLLIFTNTREEAEIIGSGLKAIGCEVGVHHSSLSAEVRQAVESQLRSGELACAVATSSLELGIDIGEMKLVAQIGSPRQVSRLIQRVGRSGHKFGGVAKGIIFTRDPNEHLESIALLKKLKRGWIERTEMRENPLDVLAHQLVGIALENGGVEIEKIINLVKNCYSYRNLRKEKLEQLADFLCSLGLLKREGRTFFPTKRSRLYYFLNLSMIPEERRYIVVDAELGNKLGSLNEEFVAERCGKGMKFVMRGEVWKVVGVDHERERVEVVRAREVLGAIPIWEGELIPVSYEVAKEVGELRKSFLNEFAELREQASSFVLPSEEAMFIEESSGYTLIHTCFGNKANEALAAYLAALIGIEERRRVWSYADQYCICLHCDKRAVEGAFEEADPLSLREVLRFSLKESDLFLHHFYQVAMRFGVIERGRRVGKGKLRMLAKLFEGTPIEEETIEEIFFEHMDIELAKRLLEKFKKGEIKLLSSISHSLSPLGMLAFERKFGLIRSDWVWRRLIKLTKLAALERSFHFVCINCGRALGTLKVKWLPKEIACRKCGAKLIAFYYPSERKAMERCIKNFLKGKLSKGERELFEKLWLSAELLMAYGRKACSIVACYGIGMKKAAQLLSSFYASEEELYKRAIEERRKFLLMREKLSKQKVF